MAVELGRDRELEVVAGDALVVGGRLDLVAAPAGRVGGVHEEDAAAGCRPWPAGSSRRSRRTGSPRRRSRPSAGSRTSRPSRPSPWRGPPSTRRRCRRRSCDGAPGRRGGAVKISLDVARCRGPPGPGSRYSRGQLLDLLEADLVDLLGRQLERRVVADHPPVGVVAVGEPGQPDVCRRRGRGPDLVADRVAVRPAIAGRTSLSMIRREAALATRPDRRRRSARPVWRSGSSAIGVASQRSIWATVSSDGEVRPGSGRGRRPRGAGRSCPGSSSRCRGTWRSSPRRRRRSGSAASACRPGGRRPGRRSGRRRTRRSGPRGSLGVARPSKTSISRVIRSCGREAVGGDRLGPGGELARRSGSPRPRRPGSTSSNRSACRSCPSCGPRSGTSGVAAPGSRGERVDGVGHGESPIRRW